jgi:fructose-1-phosphate kinase PfkB-like protein
MYVGRGLKISGQETNLESSIQCPGLTISEQDIRRLSEIGNSQFPDILKM